MMSPEEAERYKRVLERIASALECSICQKDASFCSRHMYPPLLAARNLWTCPVCAGVGGVEVLNSDRSKKNTVCPNCKGEGWVR